ncbi:MULTISPECIES: AraC family transcriptional regulator [unclassified Pseudoxanthomonas]|uniref:AraC family transcriptional regulator n=1 Tax=unclassified Pseudoxanthomonas TaxID=2645906 RepID=UPI0018327D15|nr:MULTISPECIES: AraC family transcriptional regulator [unclassified Pseudoxanthomonas]MBB3274833.1 AraC-like DNA-binding protein [Pseudoxanthomonas sp. OG2]MBV7475274.1 AraC family transcriptional regulator [Pseudoxanthomonas sp. PXM05]
MTTRTPPAARPSSMLRQNPKLIRFDVAPATWEGLGVIGLSPELVLRHARLPATLHLPESSGRRQVTTEEFFRLWEAIEKLSPDASAGIRFNQGLKTATLPPSSLIAFYARDYRDALQRTARFKALCAPERINLVESGREATLTVDWWQAETEIPSVLMDIQFTSFVELGRRGTGGRITPIRLSLKRQDDRSGAHEAYFGCPVQFGASRNELILDANDLDLPFPGHNPELLAILSPVLAAALAEASEPHTISHRVKATLKHILASGRPEMADVARELGMSERTLQRRITDEGTTYRQLLTAARQDLVRHLLAEPSIDINEVAYLVGYEDANSFYRAFRSWEGTTPARWRELALQGADRRTAH